MKKLHTVLALAFLSTSLMGGGRPCPGPHDHGPSRQPLLCRTQGLEKGAAIKHEDWDRGDRVDYHQYHLTAPPRGYEWRMVDGYYVLANISNFQIRTVIRIP